MEMCLYTQEEAEKQRNVKKVTCQRRKTGMYDCIMKILSVLFTSAAAKLSHTHIHTHKTVFKSSTQLGVVSGSILFDFQ